MFWREKFHMILSLRVERGGDTLDLGDDGEVLDCCCCCCCCCCVLPLPSACAAALEDDRDGGLLRSWEEGAAPLKSIVNAARLSRNSCIRALLFTVASSEA